MAVYSKKQMERNEKPRTQPGTYMMRVRKEMASTRNSSQHVFILENPTSEIWFGCFLPDIPQFAEACGVECDLNGNVDTAHLVGKFVVVTIEEKEHKGKLYSNVTDFRAAGPDEIPSLAQDDDEDDLGINF